HAERLQFIDVHLEVVGRDIAAKGTQDVGEFRTLPGGIHQAVGDLSQAPNIAAGPVFQHELESAGETQAKYRGQAESETDSMGNLTQTALGSSENRRELLVC